MHFSQSWHNPSGIARILSVALVYGVTGAMAASVVGAIFGHMLPFAILGVFAGAVVGARIELR
jgi:hypothetical protein